MDPNAAWEELLRLALAIEERTNDADEEDTEKALDDAELAQDAQRMAELVLALNGWAANGGFPPTVFAQKK